MDTEAAPAWVEIMDGIKRIVDEAQSLEQLRDALLAVYGDLSTDRLAEVMAMGFAAADLAGRFDVRQESAT
jgi:phage gp29-like protein